MPLKSVLRVAILRSAVKENGVGLEARGSKPLVNAREMPRAGTQISERREGEVPAAARVVWDPLLTSHHGQKPGRQRASA